MNFLGHLFFSENDTSLMLTNLYGDYFKGSKFEKLTPIQKKGVILHRAIDSFIDNNKGVKMLFKELYPLLPKITGIAVDLYFDHLLAKNWLHFHHKPLNQFIEEFYEEIEVINDDYPENFKMMLSYMKKGNWLYNYQFLEGLDSAATGLSNRISFKNDLFKAKDVFVQKEELITDHFFSYMQEAVDNFYTGNSHKLRNLQLK